MQLVSLLFHDVYRRDPGESGFRSPGADRYKLIVSSFDAQLDGVAAVRTDPPILATDLHRPQIENAFAYLLTVDDGGRSYHTVVADQLEARGWRGHAFVSTDFIGQNGFLTAAQLRELDARGHVIGSHSASHPARFSACRREEMRGEWSRSRRVLEDLLGHAVTSASLPGGYFSDAVAQTAAEAGVHVLFTSEPVTHTHAEKECLVVGRFAVRRGCDDDFSRRLVQPTSWTRSEEWASWHVKGLLKPLLGSFYSRVADWLSPEDVVAS